MATVDELLLSIQASVNDLVTICERNPAGDSDDLRDALRVIDETFSEAVEEFQADVERTEDGEMENPA